MQNQLQNVDPAQRVIQCTHVGSYKEGSAVRLVVMIKS